jgi:2-keto-4-pentenoate hydratase/2-oxohepta-3-ene-1,7-dioic acid hydratase in catechol pathway
MADQQSSNVDKLIWNVREIIADLSLFYHLQPGDLIYTGTPKAWARCCRATASRGGWKAWPRWR